MSPARLGVLCAALLVTGLAAPAPTAYAAAPRPTLSSPCEDFQPIAHRGIHPDGVDENTLRAFDRAAAAGYPIETDVWPDAEGKLWIFHDRNTFRLTGVRAQMDGLTSAEVGDLRYLKGGSPILAFDDLLTWIAQHPETLVYIEPKKRLLTLAAGEFINVPETVAAAVTQIGAAPRTWITDYNTSDEAPRLRTDYPDVQLLRKMARLPLDPAGLAAEGYDTVGLPAGRITAEAVQAHHDLQITVQAQNVNRSPAWRRAIRAGADALLTNLPEAVDAFCARAFTGPTIKQMLPARGPAGRWVTLRGRNFLYVQEVRFAARSALYRVRNARQIMVRVPRGRLPRFSKVRVINDYGTASSGRRFHRTRR